MSETEASTSQAEASSDVDVEAATLLSQGRRHLLVEDAVKAVQSLQEACQLLGSKYGELANECGESYYYYGWALLELARMETGVLGNALQGVPEDEEAEEDGGETDNVENPDKVEAEERQKIFHEVQDALEEETDGGQSETDKEGASEMENEDKESSVTKDGDESGDKPSDSEKGEDAADKQVPPSEKKAENVENGSDASKKASTTEEGKKTKESSDKPAEEKPMEVEDAKEKEGKDKSQVEDESGKDETAELVKEKSEAAEENEDDGTEDEDGEEEGAKGEDGKDEDVSNFQLSWEMLELARIIFSRHDSDEFKLKVAQVYLKLGEHGLETENFAQSIEDFKQCLTRQKEQLDNDSRLLAETNYNLALAYSFDQKFDKAIQNFEQSSVVIQNRIASLKKKAEGNSDKPLSEEEAQQIKQEIAELEALGPEIKAKIDDAKAEKNSAESAVGQVMRGAAAEFGLGTSSSSGFEACSSREPAQPIAVRKATDTKPDDISHLIHRKRKPEDAPQEESSIKKPRQEDGGGDAVSSTNGVNNVANGDPDLANGDTKQSSEKEEIKVKQVEQTSQSGTETPAMET